VFAATVAGSTGVHAVDRRATTPRFLTGLGGWPGPRRSGRKARVQGG
jgi:hypothetical protein